MKIKVILLIFSLIFCFQACEKSAENKRKIKLADTNTSVQSNQQISTTIHLEPKERRSIAVMFFQNLTGDKNLEWLQKGLTEMFIRALSESQYISTLSTERLFEIIKRLKESSTPENIDLDLAAVVAREANVEAVLTGNIHKIGDSLRINVTLREPKDGQILQQESVEGPGLENIFTMVDYLTKKIKEELHVTMQKEDSFPGLANISTNSLEAWRHFTNANEFRSQYLWPESIEEYVRAIYEDSTFLSAYIPLCMNYLNFGNRPEAAKIFEKLKRQASKASYLEQIQIKQIDALLNENYQAYMKLLEERVKQNPRDIEAYQELADISTSMNDYRKTLEYSEKMIEIDPNFKLAYNMLGYAQAHLGNFEKAVAALKKYQEIAPDEPNPFDSLGEIYLYQGDYKNAEKCFQQAIKLNDGFSASWEHLAALYMDSGEFDKVIPYLEETLKRYPESADARRIHSRIALIHWRQGRLDEALQNYQKALNMTTASYTIIKNMYSIYLQKKDTLQANKLLAATYEKAKAPLKSSKFRMQDMSNLALLTYWHDVEIDQTIKIFSELNSDEKNSMSYMLSKFWLTMLLSKNKKIEEIDAMWETVRPSELMAIFKTVPKLSYAGLWQYYFLLNKIFYKYPEAGIRNYEISIAFSFDNQLKLPEMIFRLFLADLHLHGGEEAKAREQFQIVGTPSENTWFVIGPFDNQDGFQKEFVPEREIDLSKIYTENGAQITWVRASPSNQDGFIDFEENLTDSFWSVGYGLVYLKSPDSRKVQFRMGSNESIKVWLNDEEVWRFNETREAALDDDITTVQLRPGLNKILIKVCNRIGYWGYYFRITDENGNGFSDLEFIRADEIAGSNS